MCAAFLCKYTQVLKELKVKVSMRENGPCDVHLHLPIWQTLFIQSNFYCSIYNKASSFTSSSFAKKKS